MDTSGNRFFIKGAKDIDIDRIASETLPRLPEQCQNDIHIMAFDPEEGEKESMLAFVPGESINGVHISIKPDGEIVLDLIWLGSGVDVYLLFGLMNSIKETFPKSVITSCDSDGNNSNEAADISDEARDETFRERLEMFAMLIETDVPFVRLETIYGEMKFDLDSFRDRMKDSAVEEKVVKFLFDIIDDLWYKEQK